MGPQGGALEAPASSKTTWNPWSPVKATAGGRGRGGTVRQRLCELQVDGERVEVDLSIIVSGSITATV